MVRFWQGAAMSKNRSSRAKAKKFPEMEHEEAYMAYVQAGQSGEIVWQFTRRETFSSPA